MKRFLPVTIVIVAIVAVIAFIEIDRRNTDVVLETGETVTTGIVLPPSDTAVDIGRSVGDRAPNWKLQSFEGDIVELARLKGTPVMIDYFADWCEFCHEEFPFIEAAHQKYNNEVQFIGIHRTDTESKERGEAFARGEAGATFTLVSDTSGEVYGAYTTGRPMPITFFIDSDGVIQDKVLGPKTPERLEQGIASILN